VAFVKLSQEGVEVRRRRFLIAGGPNTRKTTALLSLPKPLVVVSSPGEKGYDTIPTDDPDIIPLIWQVDPEERKPDSHAIVDMVVKECIGALTGKYGKLVSFAFDGFHKYFDYILDSVTDGALFEGMEFDPKLYRRAGDIAWEFISRLCHTPMPIVAFTTWDAQEPDRAKKKGEQSSDVPSHTYPDLPGKAAKRIMGEFSAIFHASIGKLKPNDTEAIGLWQTRPYGDVWGCGIKGPSATVKHIPTFIPAHYTVFEQAWAWAEKQAGSPGPKETTT
jgi:hypothetical protein